MDFYKKNSITILGGVICLGFLLFVARTDWSATSSFVNLSNCATPANNEASLAQVIQGSATSGKLFKGEKAHTFDRRHIKFDAYDAKLNKNAKDSFQSIDNIPSCQKWSVVTTIFEPSDAVKHQAEQKSWCLVVVGDFKGPLTYIIPGHPTTPISTSSSEAVAASVNNNERRMKMRNRKLAASNATVEATTATADVSNKTIAITLKPETPTIKDTSSTTTPTTKSNTSTKDIFIFLEKRHQIDLSAKFSFIEKLPWNHFGRKNVGYLYSIMHGAQQVWDFDDDNIYIQKEMINIESEINEKGMVQVLKLNSYNSTVFNPYPIMAAPHSPSWPRGIPLAYIKPTNDDNTVQKYKQGLTSVLVPKNQIGIIQSLANHDPDVDAIYRLIQPIPFSFYYPTQQQQQNGFIASGGTNMKTNAINSITDAFLTKRIVKQKQEDKTTANIEKTKTTTVEVPKEEVVLKRNIKNNGDNTKTDVRRHTLGSTYIESAHIDSHINNNILVDINIIGTSDHIKTSVQRKLEDKDSYTSNLNGHVLKHSILVPTSAYSPYNAQATLHMYNSLWSLYLPVTVHGRVSDIWRGYIFQRLAKDINVKLLFAPPLVRQDRNVHNYLADFNSEADLYMKSERLLQQLNEWKLTANTLPGRMEELYIHMYEHDYLGRADVELIQLWIQALHDVQYVFPSLVTLQYN